MIKIKNRLIAYFSCSGNTEAIAGMIQEIIGVDMFHIETIKPYPKGYLKTVRIAKKELKNNARPKLTNQVPDMDLFDVMYLGFPNWWGTIPMAVCSFLESYDFSGKTIIPFCSHGGVGIGRSVDTIKEICPKTKVENAIALYGSRVNASKQEVKDWIKRCE